MKIQPGGLPRGEDFFDREELVGRIQQCLMRGQHVLLLAPRRFCKSAVLERIKDGAPESWSVSLLRLEDVDRPSDLLLRILLELLEGRPVEHLWARMRTVPDRVLGRVREQVESVGFKGAEAKLRREVGDHWRSLGDAVLAECAGWEEDQDVLLLLDELPVAVEAMHQAGVSSDDLRCFLGWFRDLRQEVNGLRTVVAGSVGFDAVLRAAGLSSSLINDFRRETVGPFDLPTARGFLDELFASEGIELPPATAERIIELVGSPVPYFLQEMAHHLVSDRRFSSRPDDLDHVERVFRTRIIGEGRHSAFSHYRDRLETRYASQRAVVHAILTEVAHREVVGALEIWELYQARSGEEPDRSGFDLLMQDLRSDFYLEKDQGTDEYRFTVELFRRWWKEWSTHLPGSGGPG